MRLQVAVSDEMCERIDSYAKMMGISRSALCSMFIGQGIMAFDKAQTIMSDVGINLSEQLKKDLNKNEN